MRETLISAFPESGRPELPLNPLIVSVKIHAVIVDFLLTTPGYEERIIERAVRSTFADLSMWVCSAEDLIIQKVLANREKDWQDIEGILIEQGTKLDQEYVEDWLQQFADILQQGRGENQVDFLGSNLSGNLPGENGAGGRVLP